jgi:hypothetical protein
MALANVFPGPTTGVSNSNVLEGHIPKKNFSADRSLLEKALVGHNLQNKLSK